MNQIEEWVRQYIEQHRIKEYWREGKVLLDFAQWTAARLPNRVDEDRLRARPIPLPERKPEPEPKPKKTRRLFS